MQRTELTKIVDDYLIIKGGAGVYQVAHPAQEQGPNKKELKVLATKASQAQAEAVAREKLCAVVQEAGPDNYILLWARPQEAYIRGLALGSVMVQQLWGAPPPTKMAFDLTSVATQYLYVLAENFAPGSGLNNGNIEAEIRTTTQYSEKYNVDAPEPYPWRVIAQLAPRCGIVRKDKFCPELKTHLYAMRVYGTPTALPVPPPAHVDICKERLYYEQECNLIVDEVGPDQYQIIYCDLGRNYFRGLARVYSVVGPMTENSEHLPKTRQEIIMNLLRKEINEARERAGHAPLTAEQDLWAGVALHRERPGATLSHLKLKLRPRRAQKKLFNQISRARHRRREKPKGFGRRRANNCPGCD